VGGIAKWPDLREDPLGTRHSVARCCWCAEPLAIGEYEYLRCWVCPTPACWLRQEARALLLTAASAEHAGLLRAFLKIDAKIRVGDLVCLNVPLPSQVLFEDCPAKNVLWGGQAGPGKSHGVRWWLYKRSLLVPGHEALLTRENWEQLDKTHLRKMAAELPLFGAVLVDKTARFRNGAFIDCGHMADAEAVSRYLSTEYNAIVPEEATQTPVGADGITPLAELSTRARKVSRDVNGAIVRPKFLPVSNPGGPSAAYLCDMFVDHAPDFDKFPKLRPVFDETTGEQVKGYRAEQWAYIPARLDDNPYQDPEYEDTLANLTSWRYEQLRNGDWHVASGQFFSEWVPSLHVVEARIA
jgi:hypothetical protein